VPLYEFSCRSCGHRFEELVGSHVGVEEAGVRCPDCGAADPERLVSSVAAPAQGLTPGQKRRLEDQRGIDRGGARERFGKQRAAERARAKDRRG
jgi:putative FmdB family regulatory protein